MTQVTAWSIPLNDPLDRLRAEVEALIRTAYPLPGEPSTDGVSEATEYRVRSTDGVMRSVTPREVLTAHRRGLPVEQRKVWVTAWEPVQH
jgi:hypothetical protein